MEQPNDQPMEQSLYSLATLPMEILVLIFSFLDNVRDRVRLGYASTRLRSVCEIPSMWSEFFLPHFNTREYRCVKSVLKSFGKYIQRFSLPDRVTSTKLTEMLRLCKNVVHLSLPTSQLSGEQFKQIIKQMKHLQSLDISATMGESWPLLSCRKLKELTLRMQVKKEDYLWLYNPDGPRTLFSFKPQNMNIIFNKRDCIYEHRLLEEWLKLNPSSRACHTGCLRLFSNIKIPMDFSPQLPEFQVQFGPSCCLPCVRASNYGLLGLQKDILLLTDMYTCKGKKLCKAVMRSYNRLRSLNLDGHLNNDIVSLNLLTHFDASNSKSLHSGHLEQLALICPNLEELNIQGNTDCLKSLQGLGVLASCCDHLQGLNLLGISVTDVESRVKLWEILADLRLTYLAIESCVLVPFEEDDQSKELILRLHQRCTSLQVLESYNAWRNTCIKCERFDNVPPQLLSHFSSLVYCSTGPTNAVLSLPDIVSKCKKLRYLRYSNESYADLSLLSHHCKLQEVCIAVGRSDFPDTCLSTMSAHGGLVHVVLSGRSVTSDGITTLIEQSPHLLTLHVYMHYVNPDDFSFDIKDFKSKLKINFPERKLFSSGSFKIIRNMLNIPHGWDFSDQLLEQNINLTSFWRSVLP